MCTTLDIIIIGVVCIDQPLANLAYNVHNHLGNILYVQTGFTPKKFHIREGPDPPVLRPCKGERWDSTSPRADHVQAGEACHNADPGGDNVAVEEGRKVRMYVLTHCIYIICIPLTSRCVN